MSVTEEKFSEKFEAAAKSPKNRGAYYQEEATEKGMALVEAKFKDMKLYWLVDTGEDRVYSAKFFAYGGKVSVAIGETLVGHGSEPHAGRGLFSVGGGYRARLAG